METEGRDTAHDPTAFPSRGGLAPARPALPADHPEDLAAEVRKRLAEERDELLDDQSDNHFYVQLRGGVHTEYVHGVVWNEATCFARAHARPWCLRYRWPRQKGFSKSLYGEEGAVQLAHEWARRADHYYRLWWDNGCDLSYKFSEGDCESYRQSLEWVTFASSEDIESSSFTEIVAVNRFQPTS